MTTNARLRLASPRIDPCELVAHNPTIAVQHLEMHQPVGRNLDEKGTIRRQRSRPQNTCKRPPMILPHLPRIRVRAVPCNDRHALDQPYKTPPAPTLPPPGSRKPTSKGNAPNTHCCSSCSDGPRGERREMIGRASKSARTRIVVKQLPLPGLWIKQVKRQIHPLPAPPPWAWPHRESSRPATGTASYMPTP